MSLLLHVTILYFQYVCNAELRLQREQTINVQESTSNGLSIGLNNSTQSTIINDGYYVTVSGQSAYDIALTLSRKWAFKSTPTTLIVTIDGFTPYPSRDADLFLIFSSGDTQFFSFFIHLDAAKIRSKIYPFETIGSKSSVIGWMSDENAHKYRWDRISDGGFWVNTEPRHNKQSEWPLKFEISNDPNTNECLFSFYHLSNQYKTGHLFKSAFSPNQEMKIYILGDTENEQYQITSVNAKLFHSDHVPTISPSPEPTTALPTLNPTDFITLNPTQPPTKSPTFEPTPAPTPAPSPSPTFQSLPTKLPSAYPTSNQVKISVAPTLVPSSNPSLNPSLAPITTPTYIPTLYPTFHSTSSVFQSSSSIVNLSASPSIITRDPTKSPIMEPNVVNLSSRVQSKFEATKYIVIVVILTSICFGAVTIVIFVAKRNRKRQIKDVMEGNAEDEIAKPDEQKAKPRSYLPIDHQSPALIPGDGPKSKFAPRQMSVIMDNVLKGISDVNISSQLAKDGQKMSEEGTDTDDEDTMTSQRDSFLIMEPDGFRKDTETRLDDEERMETDTKYEDEDDSYFDRTLANPFKKIYKMSASMSPSTTSKHQLKKFQCAAYGHKLVVDAHRYNPFAIASREKKRFNKKSPRRRRRSSDVDVDSSSSEDSYHSKPN